MESGHLALCAGRVQERAQSACSAPLLALCYKTMLVSLWKRDDRATPALIGALYRYGLDGTDALSAAESMKRAQGDLREGRVPGWRKAWAQPNERASLHVVAVG